MALSLQQLITCEQVIFKGKSVPVRNIGLAK